MTTAANTTGDLSLEEFRQYGHQIVDWITAYLANPEKFPVLSLSRPGEVKSQLPSEPPRRPVPLETIMEQFKAVVMPGITHWNHPGFMAYFSSSASAPGILGELLTAALNVNAMLWKTSPAATELEQITVDWLRQMLDMPAPLEGVIMDGASAANLVAIAVARQAIPELESRDKGLAGRGDVPRLRVYVSDQAHSSVEKGAITLGIGRENVVKIPTDTSFRMRPEALDAAVKADLGAGYLPFFVCATVGTTSSTSIDPIPAIAEIAGQRRLWLHVDAAYGGMAALLPEMRHVLSGIESVDSIVVNPHKWLFTPIDCSVFYTRATDMLRQAFSLVPEYLRSEEADAAAVKDYMDFGIQLGRRFRALKLWMIMQAFGRDGLAARIREHIRLGQAFAAWVDASSDFERLAPTPFSTICFRAHPPRLNDETMLNRLNHALLDAVNTTGEIFISHTSLHGRYTLRLAIGNIRTQEQHVNNAWTLFRRKLSDLLASGNWRPDTD